MNTTATIEGSGFVPGEPVLVIPNRVDMTVLRTLEEALGGNRPITWLVEGALRPSKDILSYMHKRNAHGILFSADAAGQEQLKAKVQAELDAGRHVALLPGRPEQPPAFPTDVRHELLTALLHGHEHAVLPVYAGMYNPKKTPLTTSQAPYEKALLRLLPMVPAGPGQADGVMAAWLEASASQIGQLRESSTDTLPHVLLRSLLAHPGSTIIDGVDDSRMSYRHLLFLAASLTRFLRKHTASKRMGIILPPGKFSIIANTACILAGICPVNIDYSYDKAALARVIEQADLTRFITEHCFIDMQQDFPWPRQRDIVFIDEILHNPGLHVLSRWNILSRFITPGRIAKWIRIPATEPQDEALTVFSPAGDGVAVQGTGLSHCAVLSSARLCNCRFGKTGAQRVLSALPYYHRVGLLAGLIYPLLAGHDIITYPIPRSSKRLCRLAGQYTPTQAVFSARQAMEVTKYAREEELHATTCFHIAGKAHPSLLQAAYQQLRISLCEWYMPLEAAMPVACNISPALAEPDRAAPAHLIPSGVPGSAGLVMPGVAVRITDINHPDTPLPIFSTGLVWVRGAGLASLRPGQDTPGAHSHERWRCTGDVGCMRPDGRLTIDGPRSRFSMVKGEILSHAKIEKLMIQLLQIVEEAGKPRIAIVGLPDAENGGDRLVLLSTLPELAGPNEVLTLRYKLKNARHPEHWSPTHIVPLRAIPTLPDGRINYPLCLSLARKVIEKH